MIYTETDTAQDADAGTKAGCLLKKTKVTCKNTGWYVSVSSKYNFITTTYRTSKEKTIIDETNDNPILVSKFSGQSTIKLLNAKRNFEQKHDTCTFQAKQFLSVFKFMKAAKDH